MPEAPTRRAVLQSMLGAAAAVMAGLIGVPPVLCLLVAAAIVAANSMLGAGTRVSTLAPTLLPSPEPGSAERRLLGRGQAAVVALEELTDSLPAGPLADRSRSIRDQARATLATLGDLAGQSAAVTRLLQRLGKIGGREEKDAFHRRLARAEGPQQAHLRKTLGAHESRAQARQNLAATRTALRSRMESLAFGLEGLVARLAELLALAQSGSFPALDDRIEELALELEGLRDGLVQAEDIGWFAVGSGARETI